MAYTGTPFDGILLGFQAAGLVVDAYNTRSNQKIIQMGRQLDQAQYEANLEMLRLESAQESLDEMQQLRANMGQQIVMNAAKGTSSGAGSAFGGLQQSQAAFSSDERTRRMNLLSKESQLRAGNITSSLNSLKSETQLGQSLTSRFINTVGTTSNIDQFRRTSVGKKLGFGFEEA